MYPTHLIDGLTKRVEIAYSLSWILSKMTKPTGEKQKPVLPHRGLLPRQNFQQG